MLYELPTLAFAFGDLEPYMDARTVEIHYTKHHQTYTNKLNAALEKHPEMQDGDIANLLKNLNDVPEDIRTTIHNYGGGFFNHNFFWSILAAPKGTKPSNKLLTAIKEHFGSFDEFKTQFTSASTNLFGSGWTWLTYNKNKLAIECTPNQDTPISHGAIPLLTLDLWEHAYYLDYQNRRPDFIEAWWNIINWPQVEENYSRADL
jgi:superoxide dismutase, Fe-Mn family